MKCAACDATLTDREGRWCDEKKEHESLCSDCLRASVEMYEDETLESLFEIDLPENNRFD